MLGVKKKRKLYDPTDMVLAVKYVQAGKGNIAETSRIFTVPRKTLSDKVKTKKPFCNPGPEPMLTNEEEKGLTNYLVYMANQGFPLTRSISRSFITTIVQRSGRPSLFSEAGPSDRWFRKFLGRHPELQERRPERQDRSRTRMSNQTVMTQYFSLLNSTMNNIGVIDKPSQIFNVDESGFSGKEVGREKVTTTRGQHAYQQSVTTSDHITATVTVCADGHVLPTMVVYSKSLPHRNYTEGVPKDWLFAVSESGYMDSELFKNWLTKIFVPNCGRARPVLLILDNHDCHIQLEILEIAKENQIEFLCLPPHTTHILQPLDVDIFGPLKAKFSGLATKLGIANSHMIIGKARFPFLLNHSIDQVCSPSRVKESFRKTGIYPFDPQAIDKTQLVAPSFPQVTETPNTNNLMQTPKPAVQSCTTCGNFLVNPLVSSGLIPASLGTILQPPKAPAPKKSSKSVNIARVVTGQEMMESLREREENEKRKREEIKRKIEERQKKKVEKERENVLREERRNERLRLRLEVQREKEKLRNERLKQREKRNERKKKAAEQAAERRSARKRKTREYEENESESDQETVCKKCGVRDPIGRNGNESEIEWTTCDRCDEWFHDGCVERHEGAVYCNMCVIED